MAAQFDEESYVAKWDKVIVPLMSLFIIISLAGAFALQFGVDSDCSQNRFTYCGETPEHQIRSHHDDH